MSGWILMFKCGKGYDVQSTAGYDFQSIAGYDFYSIADTIFRAGQGMIFGIVAR